jgi:predicted O-methyltransferase YrrM
MLQAIKQMAARLLYDYGPMRVITGGIKRLFSLRSLLRDSYYWQQSRRELRGRLRRVQTVEDVVDLAWAYRGAGFYADLKPLQNRQEITCLAQRVAHIEPRVIVEIGTRNGGTLLIWSQIAPPPELLVSIDLPEGIFGGGYPAQRARLYRQFVRRRSGCRIELLRMDSHTPEARERLRHLLAGRAIDFLFIDGDHRYSGVQQDYDLYAGLVRPGGLVAFHDIHPEHEVDTIQVAQFWRELKAQAPQCGTIRGIEEYVYDEGRYGIGVLVRG